MATCTYCGKPAGTFRRRHAECEAQHKVAVQMMPAFFIKMVASSLATDRFGELLRNAAAAAHVKPDEFGRLSRIGIGNMIDSMLANGLLTEADEQRALDIAASVGLNPDEQPELEERFVKIATLRDLAEGRAPSRISIDGPMPIDLAPDEEIVWIFNRVKSYRHPRAEKSTQTLKPNQPVSFQPYFAPPIGQPPGKSPVNKLLDQGTGDLVITNMTIFMLTETLQRKFPLLRIAGAEPLPDGMQIIRGGGESASSFILDDPWFAVNLVRLLLRRAHDSRRTSAVVDETIDSASFGPVE